MGASLSTAADPQGDGVTVVSAGTASKRQNDEALLRRLAELKHSLPLIPESATGTYSRRLDCLPTSTSTHLDPALLQQLVTDYQQYVARHLNKEVVEHQEHLNAAIPEVDKQAVQLHQQLSDAARAAAAANANFSAVAQVQQELEGLTTRLGRLQQSMGEVEREVQRRCLAGS